MKDTLQNIGLNSENSIVIGSGILGALGIRKSHDIDLVVTQEKYGLLKKSGKFEIKQNHGREILADNLFEIGTSWNVLDKNYKFEDFKSESLIMDDVRYITLDFLHKVKKSWLKDVDVRQKDTDDVKLIEKYVQNNKV